MNVGTKTTQTYVVEVGAPEDLDETYNTVLLVLPERENLRMTPQDAQTLGKALILGQGLQIQILPLREEKVAA